MIRALSIKNFQLIKDVEMEFKEGLNILHGESGSGKSLILKALNIILGEKVSPVLIREGFEKALISLYFDDLGLIQKVIRNTGYHSQTIDGESVSLLDLRSKLSNLVISHTQGSQERIYNEDFQMRLIDSFCDKVLLKEVDEKQKAYKAYYAKLIEVDNYIYNIKQLGIHNQTIVETIEPLDPKPNEDEELQIYIDSYEEKLKAKDLLNQQLTLIHSVKNNMNFIYGISNKLKTLKLDQNIEGQTVNLAIDLSNLESQVDKDLEELNNINEDDLNEANSRLYELQKLKRKYSTGLNEIIGYLENAKKQLTHNDKSEEILEKAKQDVADSKIKYWEVISKLLTERQKAAKHIETKLKEILPSLGFSYVDLEIKVSELIMNDSNLLSVRHFAKFEISFNEGFNRKPMDKIVSGGEASRLSLAIIMMSNIFSNSIFILDEVDTGLSKSSLLSMIGVLKSIGNQIVCVSHSEDMINNADNKIEVYKEVVDGITETKVR